MSVHVSANPENPSYLPPHPIPLGCPSALALSWIYLNSNLHETQCPLSCINLGMVIHFTYGNASHSFWPVTLTLYGSIFGLYYFMYDLYVCHFTSTVLSNFNNILKEFTFKFIQISSAAQSCQTLCDPMDCSMPDFSVHHQLPELAQTHVHQVRDDIQLSHPLLSPSPPAEPQSCSAPGSILLSIQWVSSSH